MGFLFVCLVSLFILQNVHGDKMNKPLRLAVELKEIGLYHISYLYPSETESHKLEAFINF